MRASAAVAVLLMFGSLTACGSDNTGTSSSTETSPSVTSPANTPSQTPSPTITVTLTAPASESAPPPAPPPPEPTPEGPCSFTFPATGSTHPIDLTVTTVGCAEAQRILTAYVNAPPDPNAGNMNVRQIEDWTCLAPTAFMAQDENIAARCERPGGAIVVRTQ